MLLQIACTLAGGWLVYQVLLAIYNASPLHPLHHIPGPKLAAATYLYEFYYEVILFGRYTRRISEMHAQYGPLVRISPHELHSNDLTFADDIYAGPGRRRHKPSHQVNGTVLSLAGFGTTDHDLHRRRRAPISKFFSRGMVQKLESEVHEMAHKLCDKLLRHAGQVVELKDAYGCFTADVVSGYAFGQPLGFIEQESWHPNFRAPTEAALLPVHVFRFFPFLKKLDNLGVMFLEYLPAELALLIRTLKIDIPNQIEKTKADYAAGMVYSRPTIFAEFIDSTMEDAEKSTERLGAEGFAVVGAGTETTATALATITYHLLLQPAVLAKLRQELQIAQATLVDPLLLKDNPLILPKWTDLEKLPYLHGVIFEGLRLSYGVAARTARIAPDETLVYRGSWNKKPVEYVIPPGWAVGMSAAITHHVEDVFPESYVFKPERWLDEEGRISPTLDRNLMSFSRGSRECVARMLALCEIHVATAGLVMRCLGGMRLWDTSKEDVEYDYDMFIPMPKRGSRGIRVMMEG